MYRWHNRGGWNKSHGQVENSSRIDSFELAQTQGWSWIMCGQKPIESSYLHGDDTCDLIPRDDLWSVEIELSSKPNGYGGEQLFFICPACGQRFRFLYLTGTAFLCRKCAKLNYRSQQETSSDSMYFYHKGMKLVKSRLLTWPQIRPDGFSFCSYFPGRPRFMHQTTYRRYLARFLRYRKKHEDRLLADMNRLLKMFPDKRKE